MAIAPITNTSTTSTPSPSSTNAIDNIDMNTFLKLMITELQQQDPLNPMDNKDMLEQIAQIRAVGASDQLTTTLSSVLLGQNITSATNLIGADISAITDDGTSVNGVVNRIAIDKGVPKLHVSSAFRSTFDRRWQHRGRHVRLPRCLAGRQQPIDGNGILRRQGDHNDWHRRGRSGHSDSGSAGHHRTEVHLSHRCKRHGQLSIGR